MDVSLSEVFYASVEELGSCRDLSQVRAVCIRILTRLGLPTFKYAWIPLTLTTSSEELFFISNPEVRLGHHSRKWYLANDPKIQYCYENVRPAVCPASVIETALAAPGIAHCGRQFWEQELNRGMAHVITIPIRGIGKSVGMLSAVSYTRENAPLPLVEAWAMHMQAKVEELFALRQIREPLTVRENEILRWTVVGKTSSEIGQLLRISENTVLFHMKNLRTKLDVSNKHHLIARAFSLGLVQL